MKINIDVGQGSILAQKNKNFNFTFTINDLIIEEDDIWYRDYLYIDKVSTGNGNESIVSINLDDIIRINNFDEEISDDEEKGIDKLRINGLFKLGYKYKVDFINVNGQVLQNIKDYSSDYIYTQITDTIEIPINLITTSVNSYHLKVTVLTENEKEFVQEKEVILYNNKPTIIATKEADKLLYQINDDEGDLIKYQIKLNGRIIYPTDGEYTSLQSPLSNNITLKASDTIVNKLNTIIINVEDNWGENNQFIYTFMGEYTGLLFVDEKNEYYSDNMGEILKRLDFNTIKAGSHSDIKYVYIYNNFGSDINNLNISINKKNFPSYLHIKYGFDVESMMNDDVILTKDILHNKEKIKLYLQILLDLEFEYNEFTFEIDAEATPNE